MSTGKFDNDAVIRQVSRWEFSLVDPLVFSDGEFGAQLVPAEFVSDLASIRILREVARWSLMSALTGSVLSAQHPWIDQALLVVAFLALGLFAICSGYNLRSSILHDKLYSDGLLSRKECDAVFYRAQRADGTARWRAAIFWLGVRLGGRWSYNRR